HQISDRRPADSARTHTIRRRQDRSKTHEPPSKKINGRKRHLVVDTKGLPLFVMVTPADMTDAVGFVVLPRRWVVERTLAWVMHARRHARDYEGLIQHSETLITWAAITIMTRRITRRQSRRASQPPSREHARD
ncbi:transposase, partial [Streptomyces sp. NPDC041003]|uniref:transposase n=1 Tax=Streptomyces sp. NPDC041003 TaxID=3155730 RepID=UPI00340B6B3A